MRDSGELGKGADKVNECEEGKVRPVENNTNISWNTKWNRRRMKTGTRRGQ